MIQKTQRRYVVRTIPGPHTGGGAGDIHIDNAGSRWLEVEPSETDRTGPNAHKLLPNGEIE